MWSIFQRVSELWGDEELRPGAVRTISLVGVLQLQSGLGSLRNPLKPVEGNFTGDDNLDWSRREDTTFCVDRLQGMSVWPHHLGRLPRYLSIFSSSLCLCIGQMY